MKKLTGFISSVKNLKSVQFQFIKSKLPQGLIQNLAKFKTLRSVKVVDVPADSGFDKLGKCQGLRQVKVSHYKLKPFEYKQIIALPNLRSVNLDLTQTQLSTDDFENGLAASGKSQLVNLSLVFKTADDFHLIAIATNCPNLKRLSIQLGHRTDTSMITSYGLMSLLESCSDLKVVEVLANGLEGSMELLKEDKQMQNFEIRYENNNQLLIVRKN